MLHHSRLIGLFLLIGLPSLACNLPFASPPPSLPPPSHIPLSSPSLPSPESSSPPTVPSSSVEPPLVQPDWILYENDDCSFRLSIPPSSAVSVADASTHRIDLPFPSGTNLREKYLQVACRGNLPTCTSPLSEGYVPGSLPTEHREFNATEFTLQTAGEGAAGSFYLWTDYSTLYGDLCLSLTFVLHSVNALNYNPPLPVYDTELENSSIVDIMGTFEWLRPG